MKVMEEWCTIREEKLGIFMGLFIVCLYCSSYTIIATMPYWFLMVIGVTCISIDTAFSDSSFSVLFRLSSSSFRTCLGV